MSEIIKSTPASEVHKKTEQNIALDTLNKQDNTDTVIHNEQIVHVSSLKEDIPEVVNSTVDTISSASKMFWRNGLSIDETKTSALIICLFIIILFACVHYHYMNDISNNLKDIIETLIYSIAGINIFSNVAEKFGTNKSDKK